MPTEHNELEEQMGPKVQQEAEAYELTYSGTQASAGDSQPVRQSGADSQRQSPQQS